MLVLIAGLVVFLGVHSVSIVAPAWRTATIARVGEQPWKAVYSIVSAVGIVLIVVGFGIARRTPVVLYTPPTMLRHVALLIMVPVFPLFFAAYLPGRIKTAAKHPMLLAVKLWATAHLLANGTLGDVLLFAGFLVWAVADRISVKRRTADEQHAVPAAPLRPANDAIAIVGGLAVYALLLLWGHRWLVGVSPLG
ncbi:MAG: NnrU family protein [Rhizobacter sp.]|nr:NnrU family protein [Rhizobacter sp.]